MSKASDLDSARLQGMQYALRRINETGLDEFEKELKWRSSVKIGVNLRPQELLEAAHNIQKKLDATMRQWQFSLYMTSSTSNGRRCRDL